MRHLIHCFGLLVVAVVVSLYGCGGSSPDRSGRATSPEKKTFKPRRVPENISTDAHRSALNDSEQHPTEEPAWFTVDLDDPDPSVRLQALEAWARAPKETLDPLTYALVDPDETVRARAQELLEEKLARRDRETGVQ
jgi:hypothetical protein